MSRKWFHKQRFDRPEGAILFKVWRIISSDKDGIYSVQWLHAYKTKLGTFICMERSITLPVTYCDPVAEDMKQYYSDWELQEMEAPIRIRDNTIEFSWINQTVHDNISGVVKFASDWEYDNGKCDGGYSTYSTRELSLIR